MSSANTCTSHTKNILSICLFSSIGMNVEASQNPSISQMDTARSVNPAERINPLDRELDFEQKRLREEMINNQLKDAEERKRTIPPKEEPLDLPEDNIKFDISKINIKSSLPLSINTDDLLEKYQGSQLNRSAIYELIRELSIRLHKKGFTTTTISLPKQNIASGVLSLEVKWGLVEGWTINGKEPETVRERLLVNLTLPQVIGHPLNIHDIDQAIENMNNVAKVAKIDIVPSERLGYSILDIKISESTASHFSISMDNSSPYREREGRDRYTTSLSFGDVIFPNDSLTLSGNAKHYAERKDNKEQGASVRYSLPIGFNVFTVQRSVSIYQKKIIGLNNSYISSGKSINTSFDISRTIFREQDKKLTLFSSLRRRESENFLANTRLDVNSLNYTDMGSGARWASALWAGSIYGDITFNRGLSWWGGADGGRNVIGENPKTGDKIEKPQNYWNLTGNIGLNQSVKLATLRLNYGARLGWQYTQDNLLGAYQMGLGDEFTVRGYKSSPIFSDKGVYLSQTLSIPMPFIFDSQIEPFVGFDMAYAENNGNVAINPNPKKATVVPTITYIGDEISPRAILSGAAMGIKFQHKKWGWSLSYGRPLKKPTWLLASDVVYFSANASF